MVISEETMGGDKYKMVINEEMVIGRYGAW